MMVLLALIALVDEPVKFVTATGIPLKSGSAGDEVILDEVILQLVGLPASGPHFKTALVFALIVSVEDLSSAVILISGGVLLPFTVTGSVGGFHCIHPMSSLLHAKPEKAPLEGLYVTP